MCPAFAPPLIPHHDLVVLGQDVDELAFGFVTPLQTDDAGSGHACPSRLGKHSKAAVTAPQTKFESKTGNEGVKRAA